jgi:hypothetical protein
MGCNAKATGQEHKRNFIRNIFIFADFLLSHTTTTYVGSLNLNHLIMVLLWDSETDWRGEGIDLGVDAEGRRIVVIQTCFAKAVVLLQQ